MKNTNNFLFPVKCENELKRGRRDNIEQSFYLFFFSLNYSV